MKLNPDVKGVWVLGNLIRTIVWTIALFMLDLLFLKKLDSFKLDLGVLSGIIFVLGLLVSFTFPHFKYKYFSFELQDEELFLERGIFIHTNTFIPLARIQHIDLQQSMLDRMYGLSKIVVHTAGTRSDELTIPGLPLHYAEEVRDFLRKFIKEDVV